ncbi:MAG: hypothetical protein AAF629_33930, partial [Chloroflexota bacterium]
MNRIWHVFWREFWGHVTRKSYLLFTLGFPAFLTVVPATGGLVLALAVASALPEPDNRPVGLVDAVAILDDWQDIPQNDIEIQSFDTERAAQQALEDRVLQAYYVIPADYWQTGTVKIIYDEPPIMQIDSTIERWVRRRVRAEIAPDLLAQLDRPPH